MDNQRLAPDNQRLAPDNLRLIQCRCNGKFPISEIGKHATVCSVVQEFKTTKKCAQEQAVSHELQRFMSDDVPCLCQSHYQETRNLFDIMQYVQPLQYVQHIQSKSPVVYIDFPNFPTNTKLERKKFCTFLLSLNTESTIFHVYMKSFHKSMLLRALHDLPNNLLTKITCFMVSSKRAPESRDDILMLKHISTESRNVILPMRDSGEKYRDCGYHMENKHTEQCRAHIRFGGSHDIEYSVNVIVWKADRQLFCKVAGHCKCPTKDVIIKSFGNNIYCVPYE